MSNLMALQEKTTKLESSLSAETRLKMDLFSALGDARRQLEIAEGKYSSDRNEPKNTPMPTSSLTSLV